METLSIGVEPVLDTGVVYQIKSRDGKGFQEKQVRKRTGAGRSLFALGNP